MSESSSRIIEYFPKLIVPAIWATLRMLSISMMISIVLGFIIAIVLIMTSPNGLNPNRIIYKFLDFITNTIRSFPIIILIVAITPITRLIIGTSVGERAAIVPLTIASTPFVVRMIENSLMEVDKQLIEAAKSFGASNFQIIFKVMLGEAMPSIVSGLTLTIITFLGTTTIAGAVGAGGLGSVALSYGYQRFDDAVMYSIVVILFVMVQIIQITGKVVYKKMK